MNCATWYDVVCMIGDEVCTIPQRFSSSLLDRFSDRISFIFFRRECDALLDFITSHDSNIDHPEVQSYINRETERVDNIQDVRRLIHLLTHGI
jgi:hypothetical protein